MTRLKIALVAGGDSPEREIALQSAAQIEAALDPEKYDVTVIDLHHRDWHYTAPDSFLRRPVSTGHNYMAREARHIIQSKVGTKC